MIQRKIYQPPTDTLLSQLRSATRNYHLEVEKSFNILDPALSVEAYKQNLKIFSDLYILLEREWLANIPPIGWEPDFTDKKQWLSADLSALGLGFAEPELPLERVPKSYAWYGTFYVLEGSNLGGQLICRHLKSRFPELNESGGLRFYEGYGSGTGNRWKKFLSQMESQVAKEHQTSVVTAAQSLFIELLHRIQATQKRV